MMLINNSVCILWGTLLFYMDFIIKYFMAYIWLVQFADEYTLESLQTPQ